MWHYDADAYRAIRDIHFAVHAKSIVLGMDGDGGNAPDSAIPWDEAVLEYGESALRPVQEAFRLGQTFENPDTAKPSVVQRELEVINTCAYHNAIIISKAQGSLNGWSGTHHLDGELVLRFDDLMPFLEQAFWIGAASNKSSALEAAKV